MLKYNLGEKVFYLQDNKIKIGTIIARKFSDRIDHFNLYADGSQNDWINNATGGGFTAIYIVNNKGINKQFDEKNLFKNDAELIESLYEYELHAEE